MPTFRARLVLTSISIVAVLTLSPRHKIHLISVLLLDLLFRYLLYDYLVGLSAWISLRLPVFTPVVTPAIDILQDAVEFVTENVQDAAQNAAEQVNGIYQHAIVQQIHKLAPGWRPGHILLGVAPFAIFYFLRQSWGGLGAYITAIAVILTASYYFALTLFLVALASILIPTLNIIELISGWITRSKAGITGVFRYDFKDWKLRNPVKIITSTSSAIRVSSTSYMGRLVRWILSPLKYGSGGAGLEGSSTTRAPISGKTQSTTAILQDLGSETEKHKGSTTDQGMTAKGWRYWFGFSTRSSDDSETPNDNGREGKGSLHLSDSIYVPTTSHVDNSKRTRGFWEAIISNKEPSQTLKEISRTTNDNEYPTKGLWQQLFYNEKPRLTSNGESRTAEDQSDGRDAADASLGSRRWFGVWRIKKPFPSDGLSPASQTGNTPFATERETKRRSSPFGWSQTNNDVEMDKQESLENSDPYPDDSETANDLHIWNLAYWKSKSSDNKDAKPVFLSVISKVPHQPDWTPSSTPWATKEKQHPLFPTKKPMLSNYQSPEESDKFTEGVWESASAALSNKDKGTYYPDQYTKTPWTINNQHLPNILSTLQTKMNPISVSGTGDSNLSDPGRTLGFSVHGVSHVIGVVVTSASWLIGQSVAWTYRNTVDRVLHYVFESTPTSATSDLVYCSTCWISTAVYVAVGLLGLLAVSPFLHHTIARSKSTKKLLFEHVIAVGYRASTWIPSLIAMAAMLTFYNRFEISGLIDTYHHKPYLFMFTGFALFKGIRVAVHTFSYYFLTFPILPPMIQTIIPADVTVIIPTTRFLDQQLLDCITSILANAPAEIIISTAGVDKHQQAMSVCETYFDYNPKIRVVAILRPNKREQFIHASNTVRTLITAYVDDTVIWPVAFFRYALAPFEDPIVGIVGTVKRAITPSKTKSKTYTESFWRYVESMSLERQNFNSTATYNLDGGISVLSDKSALIRTEIIHTLEYRCNFLEEYWCGFGPMGNFGSEEFTTRHVARKGYKTVFQNHPGALVTIPLRHKRRSGKAAVRRTLNQARAEWRSNLSSLLLDRGCWWRYPWSTYAVHLSSLINFGLFYDSALVYTLWKATGTENICHVLFIMFLTKVVKSLPHLWRNPGDVGYFSFGVLWSYVGSMIKLYAFFTMWKM